MKRGIDYIGVGVGALIVDSEGNLFLSKRGTNAKNEVGTWEFPGGGVEFNETLASALKREIQEEYGIQIKVGRLLDVYDHIIPDEHQHWVSPAFICSILSGEPKIMEPDKCEDIGWFTIDEIKQMRLSQVSAANFQNYLKSL